MSSGTCWAWLGAPAGVILLMVSLTVNVPRDVVEHCLGEAALGVFVSVQYLSTVGTRLVTAVAQSAGPRLARHCAAGFAEGAEE